MYESKPIRPRQPDANADPDEVRHAIANTRTLAYAAVELGWSLSTLFRFRRDHRMGLPVRDRRSVLELDYAETFTDD